jgi:N-acetylmuramoyl-L-alanine amidase
MLEIQKQFIDYNKSARSIAPQYIVIHSTGNANDTAQNNHDYFAGGDRQASADFFVDDNNIIQIIDTDSFYSWNCGDGHGINGVFNYNCLGIEMCGTDNGNISDTTINNTLDLVRYLMDKYNIGIDNVWSHHMVSGKDCPSQFSSNNWARWYDFKNKLANGSSTNGTWEIQDGKWWYKYSDGSYAKDCWEKINNKWYLFDSQGYMLYDWKSDEGKWYYLGDNNDGAMKTGWVYDKNLGHWYYMDANGVMQKGWVKVEDKWYYLNQDGSMQTGWITDSDGKQYLLYSDGSMAHDTQIYGYSIDSHGVAIKL